MINQDLKTALADLIDTPIESFRAVSGGDIHESSEILCESGKRYFLKTNTAEKHDLLLAESVNLEAITATQAIKTPRVLGLGGVDNTSFLLLEWLDLKPQGDQYLLGRQLAEMHKNTSQQFGWPYENYIGYTLQKNNSHSSWAEFWLENRFLPQWQLALDNGFLRNIVALEGDIIRSTEALLRDHCPVPSLLHGDLWGGNKGFTEAGPVIFDPASYYGDRETDIAFTQMFGGFTQDFYLGYEAAWPLPDGFAFRELIYNLYHQLNHLNLFGEGYSSSCRAYIDRIISAANH